MLQQQVSCSNTSSRYCPAIRVFFRSRGDIVKPETVIGWHRADFRLYWRWRSRPRGGPPKLSDEMGILIRRLVKENIDRGAPRIHGSY